MRQISRDPFARTTLFRRRVNRPFSHCMYCGSEWFTKNGKPYLYNYGTQTDGINTKILWDKLEFCSKDCRTAFY